MPELKCVKSKKSDQKIWKNQSLAVSLHQKSTRIAYGEITDIFKWREKQAQLPKTSNPTRVR